MNGDLTFRIEGFSLSPKQQSLFRAAIVLSVAMHVAGILTSPYWQPAPTIREDVVPVDLADLPEEELPEIPLLSPETAPATRAQQPVPPAPPSRETIREKVSSKGLLRVLDARSRNPEASDPLSRIEVPREVRVASRGPSPAQHDYRPKGIRPPDPAESGSRVPGISGQVSRTARSSTALSSKVFRTDSGLEGEIQGGIDDRNRSAQAISATVRQYQSGIKYAYNKELLSQPALSGKITVSFVIRPDGTVESARIQDSSVNWPPLERAVLRRMGHWKFPESGGAPVRVTFPFVFHPEM